MRISDWSSDVCSSDLIVGQIDRENAVRPAVDGVDGILRDTVDQRDRTGLADAGDAGDARQRAVTEIPAAPPAGLRHHQFALVPDRLPGDAVLRQQLRCGEMAPAAEAVDPDAGEIEIVGRQGAGAAGTFGGADPDGLAEAVECRPQILLA